MGKKTRKTRWRALEIGGESDSEESNTLSTQTSKSYGHRPYYSKITYSSQSTPTRRYHQHDAKSTRSSSTASETKITFNEDEYTKITTPRQDVLFKKGYLNKPKTYQTQTSTGNSTASTGNSTGNGTPDHQSADGAEGTDLEYESQFVFPNGFVDHHGVYYINSFEPYPLVMYNPPICYSEYSISRSKRHSTGSLTESTSPHNEETSQEFSQSGGETSGTVPECNQVYNVVYPGYYYDGISGPNMVANGQASTEPRKVRKKRRRRVSKNVPQDGSTSSEDYESSDDAVSQIENRMQTVVETQEKSHENRISIEETIEAHQHDAPKPEELKEERLQDLQNGDDNQKTDGTTEDVAPMAVSSKCDLLDIDKTKEVDSSISTTNETVPDEPKKPEEMQIDTCEIKEVSQVVDNETQISAETPKHSKFNLNAEEFVPRAYRNPEQHQINPNFHFVDMHPNFIPLPFVNHPLNELGPPGFNPQFLPPGIPMGFIPHDPKLVPNFVNFVPNQFYAKPYETHEAETKPVPGDNEETKIQEDTSTTNPEENIEVKEEVIEKPKVANKNNVDIAKIVSKLEEAAKEQILQENQGKRHSFSKAPHKFNKLPRHRLNGSYNHSDGGYRSSYDRRGRHFDRNRRVERPTEQSLDSKPEVVQDTKVTELEIKTDTNTQLEATNTQEPIQPELETKTETKERPTEEIISKDNSRHSSPRHTNYKNQYQSPRRFNYYNKNTNQRATAEGTPVPPVNYSDTLKRQSTSRKPCPRYEKTSERREVIVSPPMKKDDDTIVKDSPKPSKPSSQWISVSNRKKRKNKSTNDEEEGELFSEGIESTPMIVEAEVLILTKEEEIMINEDNQVLQESPIIIKQCKSVNVVPELISISPTTQIDTFIEMVTGKEASPVRIIPDTNEIFNGDVTIVAHDIQDVEKELLKDILQQEITIAEIETPKQDTVIKPTKASSKKKSKKSVHKLCPKRIIIKDLDFSTECIEVMQEIPESSVVLEVPAEQKKVLEEPESVEDIAKDANIKAHEEPPTITEKPSDAESMDTIIPVAVCTSTPDKKKPKKKKKTTKPIVTASQSASSSSTTLNVMDESYDFLLDTSVLVDDKTNVEVSQELDRMIQKGLYGNLEEKMKSLNVSINEDFFKSLSLDTKQSTPEKGFIKATDFSSILKNTNQILSKNKPESHTNNKIDIDFTKIKLPEAEPQPSTSKDCAFLELPQVKTGSDEVINTKSKSNGRLKNKSKKNMKGEDRKLPKNDEAPLVGLNNGIEKNEIMSADIGTDDVQSKNDIIDETVNSLEGGLLKNNSIEDNFQNALSVEEKVEEVKSLLSTDSAITENEQMLTSSDSIIAEKNIEVDDIGDESILNIITEEQACQKNQTQADISDHEIHIDAQITNEKHIVQSTANSPDQIIEKYTEAITEEYDIIQSEKIVPENCETDVTLPIVKENIGNVIILNGHVVTNGVILQDDDIETKFDNHMPTNGDILQHDSSVIMDNGYPKVDIAKDLTDMYLLNGNCHTKEDNSLTNGHISEINGVSTNYAFSNHQNGYKESINLDEPTENYLSEELNGANHIEDKMCCKTYETFQVEDVNTGHNEEIKTNGFVQIKLSTSEDQNDVRKDSTGNVSDAFEATDETINLDFPPRHQKSITQAVFEWMTRTRENTPEVEILKSPDTINRELVNHIDTDEESDEEEQKDRKSKYESDEEITIFENWSPEANQNCLSECPKPDVNPKTVMTDENAKCNGVLKTQAIEQGEDVLEVYESKYGKNEDFLKLKAEIDEHKKKGKYSKHGDLPYRAICCSLM